jgi:hypothetical protein
VVHVADGAHVHVRLVALKLGLGHWFESSSLRGV